jgi:hypothetical protein
VESLLRRRGPHRRHGIDRIASQKKQIQDAGKQVINAVNMALEEYISRSGEQLTLHSVCGVSLLMEGRNDCYHINFLAYDKDSGSAAGAPVLFFTEAVILSSDETNIRLCVPVDLVTDIGMPPPPLCVFPLCAYMKAPC